MSYVQNATATVIDEKLTPVQATEALRGSETARDASKEADKQVKQTEAEALRAQFIAASLEAAPTANQQRGWVNRIGELFTSKDQKTVKAALGTVKGESKTVKVYVSEVRTMFNAWLTFAPGSYNDLVFRPIPEGESDDFIREPFTRMEALKNVREALKQAREDDKYAETMETLRKAAKTFGLDETKSAEMIEQALEKAAKDRLEAEKFAESPEGKVDAMIVAIIKLATTGKGKEKMVDWSQVYRLKNRLADGITDLAENAYDANELTDSEAVTFGFEQPKEEPEELQQAA